MRKALFLLMFGTSLLGCSQSPNPKNVKKQYIKVLDGFSWEAPITTIEPLLRESISLEYKIGKTDNQVGISKFGGNPDLPENIKWPRFDGKPMIFLAQINLSQIHQLDMQGELPSEGIVYFFIHFKEPENEFGAEYEFFVAKNEYQVIYSEGPNFEPRGFPNDLPKVYRFPSMIVTPQLFYSMPSYESLESQTLSSNDQETLYQYNLDYGNHGGNQILGYTTPLQGDVTWDWAYCHLELYGRDLSEEEKGLIKNTRPKFITLLQFSLDNSKTGFNKIGMSMGYFGITQEALKKKKFEETILVFQGT